jgi:hypothetical protein
MTTKSGSAFGKKTILAAVASLFGLGLAAAPSRASAHCDTLDGPVVAAARVALEKRDVKPVLGWVKKGDEAEIASAFKKTLTVRARSGEARELADTWFFETLVRVHRAGEGAPFTGLKPAGADLPEAVVAADQALEGKVPVDRLARHVSSQVEDGIKKRFATTMERKKVASTSVEAGREFVESYVDYVHYVEGIAAKAEGSGAHGAAEGSAHAAHAD